MPDGSLDPEYEKHVKLLISSLRNNGYTVFCALEHANYSFGGLTPPEEEFQKDLDEITSSDKMIVFLEERVSAGVQLELGFAYAKDVAIEIYQDGKPAWSNIAFSRLSGNVLKEVLNFEDFTNSVIKNHPKPE